LLGEGVLGTGVREREGEGGENEVVGFVRVPEGAVKGSNGTLYPNNTFYSIVYGERRARDVAQFVESVRQSTTR